MKGIQKVADFVDNIQEKFERIFPC